MSTKGGGKFILDLKVDAAASTPGRETTDMVPPAARTLYRQIQDGNILAHASKMTMTLRDLQTQIANIKCCVGLNSSNWSTEAEDALRTWLLRPRIVKAPSSTRRPRDQEKSQVQILMRTRTIGEIVSELKKLKPVVKEKGLEHFWMRICRKTILVAYVSSCISMSRACAST